VKVRATRRSSRYPEFPDHCALCDRRRPIRVPFDRRQREARAEKSRRSGGRAFRRIGHKADLATVARIRCSAGSMLGSLAKALYLSTGNEKTVRPRSADMQSVEFGGLALVGDLTTGQWEVLPMTWCRRRQE
jgi:hypothetical protein